MNFCTGFIDRNESVVIDASIVRMNYLTEFFETNFAISIPIDLILRAAGVTSDFRVVSGTKHSLKMIKLIQTTRLF